MAKLNVQIQESSESKEQRKAELFNTGILKSLQFPITDKEGYVTGIFTGFEPLEPTGELKTSRNGNMWTDKRWQLKFTFQVPTEDGDTLNLNFWTGTCIDGIKDDQGRYSKLTTWLVAIGALDEKVLHPKFKAEESTIMAVIQECFEKKFRFKTEMKGRIHTPIISTFELMDDEQETEKTSDTEE